MSSARAHRRGIVGESAGAGHSVARRGVVSAVLSHSVAMMRLLLSLALLIVAGASVSAQSLPAAARAILGDWTIRSDETGEAQAVVRFAESGGVVSGRIVRVLPTAEYPEPAFICDDCKGAYRGADLRRIELVSNMLWRSDEFAGGRIVDPQNDRTYRATMKFDGRDRLRVRGYVGIRALGRTQVWERAR